MEAWQCFSGCGFPGTINVSCLCAGIKWMTFIPILWPMAVG